MKKIIILGVFAIFLLLNGWIPRPTDKRPFVDVGEMVNP